MHYSTGRLIPKKYLSLNFYDNRNLKISKSKKSEQYFRDTIEIFIRSSMNTLLATLKVTDARRDVTLAGGLYHRFPWRHLPPPPEWSFWSFAALPSTVLYRPQPIVHVSVLNTNKWKNDYTCNIHLWHFLLFSWKCFLQNVQKRKKRREEKVGNQRKFVKKKKRSFTRYQCIPENQMVEKFQSIFSFKIIIS